MAVNDQLGKRMKTYYEAIPKTKLMRRTPVAIRLDGKAFHTFTKGFQKPFDPYMGQAMINTMEYLCKNIQGCVFGYTQSDEITLLLIDYQTFETEAWFDYEVQKMCSIAASMATMAFNRYFAGATRDFRRQVNNSPVCTKEEHNAVTAYERALARGARFDARVFNIPKEEACNLIYWRQLDAVRNSIRRVGQTYFSCKELHGKTCADILQMLHEEKGVWWEENPIRWQRGAAWTKEKGVDCQMPMLVKENRAYIEDLIFVSEE